MRVLVISHMFPNKFFPQKGNFIFHQVISLKRYFPNKISDIAIISPVPKSFSFISKLDRKWKFYLNIPSFTYLKKWGINVLYPRYLVLPAKMVPFMEGWFFGIEPYTMAISLKESLKSMQSNFDLVYAHTAIPDCLAAILLKPFHKLPVICHFRGSDIHTYPYYNRLSYRAVKQAILRADEIVCVSDALREEVYRIVNTVRNIKVVYNGVEIDKFFKDTQRKSELRGKYEFEEDDIIVLFVGALIKEKGIVELMNIMEHVLARYSNVYLFIVGDGPLRGEIERLANMKGIRQRIKFWGKRTHEEVSDFMKMADIFAFPTHAEGMPNVVLEAMASGLPIVSTKVGGIPEAIEDQKDGFLVDAGDVTAFRNRLMQLIENKELRQKFSDNAIRKIYQKFTWESSARKLVSIFEEVLHGK